MKDSAVLNPAKEVVIQVSNDVNQTLDVKFGAYLDFGDIVGLPAKNNDKRQHHHQLKTHYGEQRSLPESIRL